VRRRDLLWRDFSRLCWRSLPALRTNTPVLQSTPVDDVEVPRRAGEPIDQVTSPP
ncbi:hypothetical protein T484DRAFT_1866323, partial [Baffinella frigidus]